MKTQLQVDGPEFPVPLLDPLEAAVQAVPIEPLPSPIKSIVPAGS